MANVSGNFYAIGDGSSSNFGLKLVNEVWARQIEAAVYEDMVFANSVTERDRLYNKLHIRKIGQFTPQTIGQYPTTDGTTLSYSAAADTEVTLIPTANYVAVALHRSQLAQMNVDPRAEFRQSVEQALAQKIDNTTLQYVAQLVTTVAGGASVGIDRALLLNTLSALRTAARMAVQPGTSDIRLVIHPNQIASVMSIPEITSANLRGDGENPNVKGIVLKGLGITYDVSGNVYNDGTVLHNPLYVKSAFGISWNERPSVMAQEFELQSRIIAYCNYGFNIIWDDRAADLKTKTTV